MILIMIDLNIIDALFVFIEHILDKIFVLEY